MSPKLAISHLSKSFGNLHALDNISLYLKDGEFVSLIGPSGCGKTTLFDIIAGVEKATTFAKLSTEKVGYMLQKPLLLPWRTVEENIRLGMEIKRIKNPSSDGLMIMNLLKEFGLLEFANFYPSQLSGGMAQRVALLRTIMFNQDFLLLDEPFGALDALTRISCQMWLQQVVKKFRSSVLFITHDIREVIFLSDRIYVLSPRPGKIIQEVKVDLPRPRNIDHLQTKKAEEIEKELLKLLMSNE